VHPSVDAPAGCCLTNFSVACPQTNNLPVLYNRLGVEVVVARGEKAQLRARIVGSDGELELSS
jgi:hypothetical protein